MTEHTIISAANKAPRAGRMPWWLKRPVAYTGKKTFVETELARAGLTTVCAEAKCPNRSECYARGTATFLIMGDTCSRGCAFCGVRRGAPRLLDDSEPSRVCETVKRLGLRHVVITSVTRDDLPDGGAGHFARTVTMLRQTLPGCTVEILVPDFRGNEQSLATVFRSRPDVFNHNIETVPRLYPAARPEASYQRSLGVLSGAAQWRPEMIVKSGIMVGLGETFEEVTEVLTDMRRAGCCIVTIGQYLQPSSKQAPVDEFIEPGVFKRYEAAGRSMGFARIVAGPYVRSSYKAMEAMDFASEVETHDRASLQKQDNING